MAVRWTVAEWCEMTGTTTRQRHGCSLTTIQRKSMCYSQMLKIIWKFQLRKSSLQADLNKACFCETSTSGNDLESRLTILLDNGSGVMNFVTAWEGNSVKFIPNTFELLSHIYHGTGSMIYIIDGNSTILKRSRSRIWLWLWHRGRWRGANLNIDRVDLFT